MFLYSRVINIKFDQNWWQTLQMSNKKKHNQNVTYDLITPRWPLTPPSYAPSMFLYPRVITKFDQNLWKTLERSSNFTNFNQKCHIRPITPPSYAPSMFLYPRVITTKFDQSWWNSLQMSSNFTNFNQNVTCTLTYYAWPVLCAPKYILTKLTCK